MKRQLGQQQQQTTETTSAETTGKPIHHWSRREGKGTNETAKSNPLAMGLKPSPHQARLDGHERSRPWTGYEALYEGAQAVSASQRALPRKRSALVSRDLWALPTDQLNDPTAHEQPPAGMHKAHRANCKSIHSCLSCPPEEYMPKPNCSCPLRQLLIPSIISSFIFILKFTLSKKSNSSTYSLR